MARDYKNLGEDLIPVIEEVRIGIKLAIKNSIEQGINKEIIKEQVRKMVDSLDKQIRLKGPKYFEFAKTTRSALIGRFAEWYNDALKSIGTLAKTNPMAKAMHTSIYAPLTDATKEKINNIKGKPFVVGSDGLDDVLEVDTRFKWTSGTTGYSQMQIDDYDKKIKTEINKLSGKTLTTVKKFQRGDGTVKEVEYRLSIRNLAEMTVRHEAHNEDLEELKKRGKNLVLVSQHGDASERCAPWQGRLYSLDGSTGHTKDNNHMKYTPLEEARERGLFGYNCRHRLIEYLPNMYVQERIRTNSTALNKNRSIEAKQRQYERDIRRCKENQVLATSPEERKHWQEKSKQLTQSYEDYSKSNGKAHYPWRCSITKEERQYNALINDSNRVERLLPSTKNVEINGIIYEKYDSNKNDNKYFKDEPLVWVEKLTESEQKSVIDYTDKQKCSIINSALRHKKDMSPVLEKRIDDLSNALKKFELPNDIVVYRDVDIRAFTNIRETIDSDNPYDWIGEIHSDAAFQSTSIKEASFDDQRKYMIVYYVKKGTPGAYINNVSNCPDEYEFLLDKGIKSKVLAVTEKDGRYIIEMECDMK